MQRVRSLHTFCSFLKCQSDHWPDNLGLVLKTSGWVGRFLSHMPVVVVVGGGVRRGGAICIRICVANIWLILYPIIYRVDCVDVDEVLSERQFFALSLVFWWFDQQGKFPLGFADVWFEMKERQKTRSRTFNYIRRVSCNTSDFAILTKIIESYWDVYVSFVWFWFIADQSDIPHQKGIPNAIIKILEIFCFCWCWCTWLLNKIIIIIKRREKYSKALQT